MARCGLDLRIPTNPPTPTCPSHFVASTVQRSPPQLILMTSLAPSRTASPAPAGPSTLPNPPRLIQYTVQEQTWRTLRDALKVATIPLDPLPYVPYGTPPELAPHIDAAYNAGILTGIGRNTSYDIVTLPNTSAAMQCQHKYFQHGLRYGISSQQPLSSNEHLLKHSNHTSIAHDSGTELLPSMIRHRISTWFSWGQHRSPVIWGLTLGDSLGFPASLPRRGLGIPWR